MVTAERSRRDTPAGAEDLNRPGTIGRVQLGLTLAAAALAPLPFGSVDQTWIMAWLAVLSLSIIWRSHRPFNRAQLGILTTFLALCGLYAAIALVQVYPNSASVPAESIWSRASGLLHLDLAPRLSARADIPTEATGRFLLLVVSFLSGFLAGTSRTNTHALFKATRFAILCYAVYGLLDRALTPQLILWAPKTAYLGDLTSTFVNRNTAAALLGAGVILWACATYQVLGSAGGRSLRVLLLSPSGERVGVRIIARGVACTTCVLALLSTGSRAGLICASLGLLAAAVVLAASGAKRRLRFGLIAAGCGLVLAVSWIANSREVLIRGLFDEGRAIAYGYSFEAVRQHPWLGTGAGTFAEIFPAFRGEVLPSWGVWDFAHSSILEIAVEMGMPMAVLIAAASLCALIVVAHGALRAAAMSGLFLSAVLGIMLMTFLHSLVDFPLQIPGYMIPFAILAGCGLARAGGMFAAAASASQLENLGQHDRTASAGGERTAV